MKKSSLDLSDVLAVAGIVAVAVGLWWIYRPAALIAVGAYLLLTSIAASRARK